MSQSVTNCDGCGACCRHMGTPPGYAAFFPLPGHTIPQWARDSVDHARIKAMPATLRASLRRYYQRVWRGQERDRSGLHVPCLWYDEPTGRCRFHEHRPEVCREFEVGGDGCLAVRQVYQIDGAPSQ